MLTRGRLRRLSRTLFVAALALFFGSLLVAEGSGVGAHDGGILLLAILAAYYLSFALGALAAVALVASFLLPREL